MLHKVAPVVQFALSTGGSNSLCLQSPLFVLFHVFASALVHCGSLSLSSGISVLWNGIYCLPSQKLSQRSSVSRCVLSAVRSEVLELSEDCPHDHLWWYDQRICYIVQIAIVVTIGLLLWETERIFEKQASIYDSKGFYLVFDVFLWYHDFQVLTPGMDSSATKINKPSDSNLQLLKQKKSSYFSSFLELKS